jgi:hypothetical protein
MAWDIQVGTFGSFNGTTWAVDWPDDIDAGDWLYIIAVSDSDHTTTTEPTGFAEIHHTTGGSTGTTIWEKQASGSESGTIDVTFGGSEAGIGGIVRIRGALASSPRELLTEQSSSTSTPSIDPTVAGSLKVAVFIDDPAGAQTVTWGNSFVEQADANRSGNATLSVATKEEDTNGAATFTLSDGGSGAGLIWSMKPAAGDITKTLGVVTETDSAQALTFVKDPITKTITSAVETDVAQALSFVKQALSVSITHASETDAAQALSVTQQAIIKTITAALETDIAVALSVVVGGGDILVTLTPVGEFTSAQSLAFTQAAIQRTLTPATELEAAQALALTQAPLTVVITPAAESDQAQALGFVQQAILKTLTPALELDDAVALVFEGGEPPVEAFRRAKWYISRPGWY